MSQGGIWWVYERFLGLPVLVVLVTLWLVGGTLLVGACARWSPTCFGGCSEVNFEKGTVEQEDEEPLSPWREAGSSGEPDFDALRSALLSKIMSCQGAFSLLDQGFDLVRPTRHLAALPPGYVGGSLQDGASVASGEPVAPGLRNMCEVFLEEGL